jgi:serine/threonine protein kinase
LLDHLYFSFSGFFGEVFRGIWNGTDVAIKVFLEQDLTAENMEDFCNEISILRYLVVDMQFVGLFLLCPTCSDPFCFSFEFVFCFHPADSDILMVFSNT